MGLERVRYLQSPRLFARLFFFTTRSIVFTYLVSTRSANSSGSSSSPCSALSAWWSCAANQRKPDRPGPRGPYLFGKLRRGLLTLWGNVHREITVPALTSAQGRPHALCQLHRVGPSDCMHVRRCGGGSFATLSGLALGREHCTGDVRFWHKADMVIALSDVCFWG